MAHDDNPLNARYTLNTPPLTQYPCGWRAVVRARYVHVGSDTSSFVNRLNTSFATRGGKGGFDLNLQLVNRLGIKSFINRRRTWRRTIRNDERELQWRYVRTHQVMAYRPHWCCKNEPTSLDPRHCCRSLSLPSDPWHCCLLNRWSCPQICVVVVESMSLSSPCRCCRIHVIVVESSSDFR